MPHAINATELYRKMQTGNRGNLLLPPPSFTVMQSKIVDFCESSRSITVKIPVLEAWLNPYGTMQGGMINAAIDNAVGPLSLLVAPLSMTRTMETKFVKPITMEIGTIHVKAVLNETRKKRLTFGVSVEDESGNVFCRSTVVNFVI